MINVYDSKGIDFSKNGLIVLSDCISCNINEELNGLYELELEYPLDENGKWKQLLEGNIIKADSQLFRIYHKIKTLNIIKVNCRHIYYDLLDNFLEDITLTNINGAGALDLMLTNTQYAHSFTSLSDVSILANKQFIRKNVVESIMGTDGLINNIGGELVRDNFNIKLLGTRGLDRGVLVAYGKNVQGIEETLDTDGICTRLMPVGKDGLLLTEKYIDSPYINNFSHPKIKVVELSDYETEGTLRVAGQEYMANNKIDIPQFNYKIDFLELSKTEEYKNYAVLERVYLGDTVTIKHNRLDINLKAKVIKITKNILTDRIEKIELGSFKDNIATTINNSIQEVKQDIVQVKSDYQKAIEDTTALITGSTGGNLIIKRNAEGQPVEIDVMDTISELTCSNVWRWNLDGFAHSSSGFAGPFTVGITADGHILGELITALSISASQIKTDELVVGTNIAMGPNAQISWDNVTSKPVIPTLPSYITSTKITATTIESPAISAGTIASSSISAGTITGASISAGTISGVSITGGSITGTLIKTSNTSNFTMLYDQYTSYYHLNLLRLKLGFDTVNNYPSMQLYGSAGGVVGSIIAGGSFASFDGNWTVEAGSSFYMYGSTNLATQSWVSSNYATESWVSSNYTTKSWTYSNFVDYSYERVFLPNNCYLECLTNRLIMHANTGSYLDIRDTGTWLYATDGTNKQL